MIVLIVIGVLLLICILLLASSLTIELEYDNDLKYKVKYLCFTIAPLSPKQQKKKKRKEEKKKRKEAKKALKQKKKRDKLRKKRSSAQKGQHAKAATGSPAKSAGNTEKKPSEAEASKDKQQKSDTKAKKPKPDIGLIIKIIKNASPHVKRIFKKIRFTKVYADIVVGGDDAAKTAVSYGAHCAAVNGLIAFLDNTVTFKKEKINIRADFDLEKTDYYLSGTIKLRLSTLLHSVIWGYAAVKNELEALADAASQDNAPQDKKAA